MVTGSDLDFLMLAALILLILATATAAFWPPHRHQFLEKITEHWDYEGHHYVSHRCICGKERDTVTLIEEQSDAAP